MPAAKRPKLNVGIVCACQPDVERLRRALTDMPDVRVAWERQWAPGQPVADLLAGVTPVHVVLNAASGLSLAENSLPEPLAGTAVLEGTAGELTERLWEHAERLLGQEREEAAIRARAQAAVLDYTRRQLTDAERELVSYARQLKQRERLAGIGQMAAAIVHDLRNPLSVIRGMSDLLAADATSTDERHEFAAVIREQAERMQDMVLDILDFTRGEELALHYTRATPADLLARAKRFSEAQHEGLEVVLEPSADADATVIVDGDRLYRVLLNLVNNAIEAMGGRGRVRLRAQVGDGRLAMRVADEGPGIPPEVRENLFEPFVTRGKRSGTGLGLAISRQIVEAHGGTISVQDTGAQGTTFLLELPAQPPDGHERGRAQPLRRGGTR
jgi:signal transduction histidine kinase